MKPMPRLFSTLILALAASATMPSVQAAVGVGAKPPKGAEVILDGTRKLLDEKWTYWEGPGFASALPIKW